MLLSIVHLHLENGKVTLSTIPLVGLGGCRSALCPVGDRRLASRCHYMDPVPLPDPDLHLHRLCHWRSAWLQPFPTRHGTLAHLLLYVDPPAAPMDIDHRSGNLFGGTVSQRCRT